MKGQLAQIRGIDRPDILRDFKFWTGGNDNNFNVLLGELVSRIMLFAIVIAGLIFFVKLLLAGYGYLTSAGEPAKVQSTSKGLLNAAIGLLLVFSTYFVAQIIQIVFGINIL